MTQRTRSTLLAGLSVIALAAPVAAQQAPAPEPSVAAAAEADPASTIIVNTTVAGFAAGLLTLRCAYSGAERQIDCAALVPVSLVPTFAGIAGPVYFGSALVLSVALLVLSVRFALTRREAAARALFFGSITYLPLIWIVNPDRRTVHMYTPDGTIRRLTAEQELTGEPLFPAFRVRVADLFPEPLPEPTPEATPPATA